MPVPPSKESLPHGEVLKELFVKAGVMEATTDPPSEINNALQKRSTRGDHFTCELQGAYEGL